MDDEVGASQELNQLQHSPTSAEVTRDLVLNPLNGLDVSIFHDGLVLQSQSLDGLHLFESFVNWVDAVDKGQLLAYLIHEWSLLIPGTLCLTYADFEIIIDILDERLQTMLKLTVKLRLECAKKRPYLSKKEARMEFVFLE